VSGLATGRDLAAQLVAALGLAEACDVMHLSGGANRQTWSFVAVWPDGRSRPLVVQVRGNRNRDVNVETAVMRAAAAAGVPVPAVLAASADGLETGAPYSVLERVDGETIGARIVRDERYSDARRVLAAQLGAALARLHSLEPTTIPGLGYEDPLSWCRSRLDQFTDAHPVLEWCARQLEKDRPASRPPVVVHGDFRVGNLIVGPEGLRAVLDWEGVHVGDPVEDIGWLCVRSWRFGGPGRVGGVAELDALLAAYRASSGAIVDVDEVAWWEAVGTLKWAVGCVINANEYLSGERPPESAAIGRRVCECEHDLLAILAP
jgi:aminoglycoside phosphotransferase (APT) family kinase protein